MIENTSLLFLNLESQYVNNIFLSQYDVLILVIIIMLLVFWDSIFCTIYLCIFFNWFFCVFCNYDFLLLIVIVLWVLHTMIFLISFFCFVICIFKTLVSNTDFFSSYVDVFHICYCNMLFNMIIHILLICLFFLSADFLFYKELLHISFYFFQWILFLNNFSCLA